jgi:Tfp pilus assembly protein FimT
MTRRHGHSSGFTLIELVVIVGLMGLLLLFAVPATKRYMDSNRMTGAANTLAADMHEAHTLASAENRTYSIVFGASSYALVRGNPVVTVRTRQLPSGVTATASDTATFYAWGLSDPVTVRLLGKRDSAVVRLATNGSVTR